MRPRPRHATFALGLALCGLLAAAACAAPGHSARYRVTFEAAWSAATHPEDFPPDPHFSWLIGGTHSDQVAFWAVGDTASLGIERMAEWGSITPLDEEIEAVILAGEAGEILSSVDYTVSPGFMSTEFTVTPDFPLATVVTMVAPSPDWFTGVAGLDLRDGDAWVEELVVDMYPFDAGTDSGASYTAGNANTVPHESIAPIAGSPFAPGVPLGTMTFTLLTSSTDVPAAGGLETRVHPNPFNPRTVVSFTSPAPGHATVRIHDLRGRVLRELWRGPVDAGRRELTWDGRDDAGRRLPSGVYLVAVRVGVSRTTTKILFAR
ncbi:spondin domain-containing protein [bacterium]|nr:spondin domain-containing protein [bacterium]